MVTEGSPRMAGWWVVTPTPRGPARLWSAPAVAAIAALVVLASAPPVPAATMARRPRPAPSTASSGPIRTDRVIVRMKPGKGAPRGARSIASVPTQGGRGDVHLVEVPHGRVSDEIAKLRNDPSVDVAQPDHIYSVDATTPNDNFYPQQWAFPFINAPDAWSTTTGANGPVVAVLDTGVDYNHPDLAQNVWSNPGGIWNCAAGKVGYNVITSACDAMDDAGHGTHVSGTIAARGNNGIGVTGVNWQARVMPLKMLDSQGNGDDFGAITAINMVIDAKNHGVPVKVINASWGGPGRDTLLDDAINNAWNNGILFVAAAGNDFADNDKSPLTFQDPCGAPHVVCVAAIDNTGQKAPFSNWGVNSVTLAAPGVDIVSTWPGNQYRSEQGTSMATPHVAGAAALLLSVCPSFGAAQLRERLLDVTPDPALQGLVATGGYLNLYRALNAPSRLSVVQNGTNATLSWSPPCAGSSIQLSWGNQSASTTGTSYKISNLTPNTTYGVTVTASNPPGPPTSAFFTPLGGGYVLDVWGGLHGFASAGPAPPSTKGGPYWPGWSIARSVALLPSGTGGYVLDGYGGLHPFAVGPGPAPPPAEGGPYWPGWDIARGITILNDGSGGYVIDGYGGLHAFSITGSGPPPVPTGAPYWPGWDIARGLAVVPGAGNTSGGYVLDGFGGLHAFAIAANAPAQPTDGPYWPGWDIARGVTMARDDSGGFVTDGWGGLHPFGRPPPASGGPYWRGWQVATGVGL